jgi:hypothetical protein
VEHDLHELLREAAWHLRGKPMCNLPSLLGAIDAALAKNPASVRVEAVGDGLPRAERIEAGPGCGSAEGNTSEILAHIRSIADFGGGDSLAQLMGRLEGIWQIANRSTQIEAGDRLVTTGCPLCGDSGNTGKIVRDGNAQGLHSAGWLCFCGRKNEGFPSKCVACGKPLPRIRDGNEGRPAP